MASQVRTDFTAGRRFVRVVARASAQGATAVSVGIQKRAVLGMKYAQNSVVRKITTGRTYKGEKQPEGIEYYVGKGSALGGYPGIRSGLLQRTLDFQAARPARTPKSYATASAPYAYYVHNYENGQPKRPYLTLPLTYSKRFLHERFATAFRRAMAQGTGGA